MHGHPISRPRQARCVKRVSGAASGYNCVATKCGSRSLVSCRIGRQEDFCGARYLRIAVIHGLRSERQESALRGLYAHAWSGTCAGAANNRKVPHSRRPVGSKADQFWLTIGVEVPDGIANQLQQYLAP